MTQEPTTPKRAQVQAAVLQATEELLAEGIPFADLNIERIATRAGISRTAFYFYFKDKRELLMRLTEDVTDTLFAAAAVWFSEEGDAAKEALHVALEQIAELYEAHGVLLRAIVEVSTYDEEIAVFWRGLLQRFVDATERRIAAEQAAGNAPQMPAAATAFALVWMVERTYYQRLVQDNAPQEVVEAVHGVWLRAIYGA